MEKCPVQEINITWKNFKKDMMGLLENSEKKKQDVSIGHLGIEYGTQIKTP